MLPRIDLPKYQITLPVSGAQLEFRAYTAREEKILLIAKEAGEPAQLPVAINQIISNCTGIKDPDTLCEADRDYIIVQLRSKVSGNIEQLKYTCKHPVDGDICNTPLLVELDLNAIGVGEVKPKIIQLSKTVGIEFRYPSIRDQKYVNSLNLPTQVDGKIRLMYECLVSIFTQSTVDQKEDISFDEFEDWLLDLPSQQYELVSDFFDNLPVLSYTTKVVCPTCKTEHDVTLRGMDDFFPS